MDSREGMTASVLLVDPDASSRELLARQLGEVGFRVAAMAGGEEAIERSRSERSDVAVLVVATSAQPGPHAVPQATPHVMIDLCRRLKAARASGSLPVLLVLPDARVESKVEALRGGADDVVVRPVEPIELRVRIEAMLRMKRVSDEALARKTAPHPAERHPEPAADTGVARAFGTRVAEEMRRAAAESEPLAVLLVVPYSTGPGGGGALDALLGAVTGAIRRAVRPSDVVARAGDREIGVLCLGVQLTASVEIADHILHELSRMPESQPNPPTHVSYCIGLALYPSKDVSSPEDLERIARQALSRATSEGPGSICVSLNRQGYLVRR